MLWTELGFMGRNLLLSYLLNKEACILALKHMSRISWKERLIVNWRHYSLKLSHRCVLELPRLLKIHAKMLHKHLQRLEEQEDGEEKLDMADHLQPEEESEPHANDAETYSPERIEEEVHVAEEEAEEAGSFSPDLLHGDENEEVMDPEEDRAILVSFLIIREHSRFQSALV
ncbi:hypothetical protein M0R45_001748 [Rubus argutus]|uniref:Uncharacterized protein n=1 Tax=Rubus argutus TaxID=59490 RepID=A0AAW1VL00_RUBAR